jgi:hypothetical protein
MLDATIYRDSDYTLTIWDGEKENLTLRTKTFS